MLQIIEGGKTEQLQTPVIETLVEHAKVLFWLDRFPEKTRKEYQKDLDDLDKFIKVDLFKLTEEQVQAYLFSLREKGFSKATIKRKLSSVSSLFSYLKRGGLVTVNPCSEILNRLKNPSKKAQRILSEKEVEAILDQCNPRDYALIKLLYWTGIRVSELTALTWESLRENPDGSGSLNIACGKGEKERNIKIAPWHYKELQAFRAGAATGAVMFPNPSGKNLSSVGVEKIIRKNTEKAGITRNVSPHWFRHSCISHALNRGCKMEVMTDQAGHSSSQVTDGYNHIAPDQGACDFLQVGKPQSEVIEPPEDLQKMFDNWKNATGLSKTEALNILGRKSK